MVYNSTSLDQITRKALRCRTTYIIALLLRNSCFFIIIVTFFTVLFLTVLFTVILVVILGIYLQSIYLLDLPVQVRSNKS
jgi:hypothetical protein